MHMAGSALIEWPTSVNSRLRQLQGDWRENPPNKWMFMPFPEISNNNFGFNQFWIPYGTLNNARLNVVSAVVFWVHWSLFIWVYFLVRKSPLKEWLFFKFCFFVVLMILNAVSGPSLPTELRLDTPRSVPDPQTCCWSSVQITGTASFCSGHDDQEQDGRVREEETRDHLMLKSAASQKHFLAAGLSGTSHKFSFLCKA